MRTYIEKIHAKRVQKMMEKPDPCMCCPAAKRFNGDHSASEMWANYPCYVCMSFVGLPPIECIPHYRICPCNRLDDAIKRTWIALKEKGYLEGEDA